MESLGSDVCGLFGLADSSRPLFEFRQHKSSAFLHIFGVGVIWRPQVQVMGAIS